MRFDMKDDYKSEKAVILEEIFDEVNVDFYSDFKRTHEVSVPTDLSGYFFVEYLPEINKEEREARLKQEREISLN